MGQNISCEELILMLQLTEQLCEKGQVNTDCHSIYTNITILFQVKAECPLCKQAFRSIIHNVRSNHQYEEYLVVQRQTEAETTSRIDIDRVTAATHRFRYRYRDGPGILYFFNFNLVDKTIKKIANSCGIRNLV